MFQLVRLFARREKLQKQFLSLSYYTIMVIFALLNTIVFIVLFAVLLGSKLTSDLLSVGFVDGKLKVLMYCRSFA